MSELEWNMSDRAIDEYAKRIYKFGLLSARQVTLLSCASFEAYVGVVEKEGVVLIAKGVGMKGR